MLPHPPQIHNFTIDATNDEILFTEPQQRLFVAPDFDAYKDGLDQCLAKYGNAMPAGHPMPQ